MVSYIVAIVVVAFLFDFINGFHDSANSIATIVGTRVLKPFAAVCWAAVFNFAALFWTDAAVAKAIGSGFIDVHIVTPNLVLGALLGAIVWNLITWYYGIPSSSSHALVGGLAGSALAKAGLAGITWGGPWGPWQKTLSFIVLSPLIGMIAGFTLMVAVYWTFQRVNVNKVDRIFRPAQLASSAFLSYAHGGNDAQKTIGVVVALLMATQSHFRDTTGILHHMYVTSNNPPKWVEYIAYSMISLGTLFGGWRIVHTMGSRITRLRPVGGFCAETGGALTIFIASKFGIPVSTTHTITGSIVGVGATNRLNAVRWGLAGRIVWAWVITIPAAGVIAALSFLVLNSLVKFG